MSKPKAILATAVFVAWITAVMALCILYPVVVLWLCGVIVVGTFIWFVYDCMREL